MKNKAQFVVENVMNGTVVTVVVTCRTQADSKTFKEEGLNFTLKEYTRRKNNFWLSYFVFVIFGNIIQGQNNV